MPRRKRARGGRARGARYAVDVTLKAYDITKVGTAITLTIRADREPLKPVLGTIEIGQGTFGWRASNAKRFIRLDWSSFAKRMSRPA